MSPAIRGGEDLPVCTRRNVLYENVCVTCNPEAGGKGPIKEVKERSLYVGESSRSLYERSREHMGQYNKGVEESHMEKHRELYHKEGGRPVFRMKAVKYFRSSLKRQLAEAVRIRRRGGEGAVLNSKAEFNRCYIPRLRMVEEEESKAVEQVEEQEIREWSENQREDDVRWERKKGAQRGVEARAKDPLCNNVGGSKRTIGEQAVARPSKRRKFALINRGWGETREGAKTTPDGTKTTGTDLSDVVKMTVPRLDQEMGQRPGGHHWTG